MKIHNFSAGPSIMPREVMEEAAAGLLNFDNTGLGIAEMSHRTPPFESVMNEATMLVRELMQISDEYGVFFTSGGASTQFYQVPMNLLHEGGTAAYIETGVWAKKAIKEAQLFGNVNVLASSKDQNFNYIPRCTDISTDVDYLHITSNNTIYGTEYSNWPETGKIPLVCDMSSDIFSRETNYNHFDLIYAGAQKNMGPAGTTLVVVRNELLGKTGRQLPSMVDYRNYIENNSMYNTPPVFPIYMSMLVLRWIKQIGGIPEIQKRNEAKAALMYAEIDRNSLFEGTAKISDRSLMNACFIAKNPDHTTPFLEMCKQNGIYGLKGHRLVGGFRASMYNALPIESVQFLVDLMKEFESKNS